ncbi:helix-turn-helix domain-containing protein [Chryseobacterium sp. Tr-659]|uniref:helix-turn-helix domain-containing protein n=1 Tax=Chryseobacterium sp. Tr-659 TaxID=2608340 RepID=UPI00141DC959|nr:helix-turn-helix domain-containing protein [Chryseobacterium sp. Tr-659]NIF06693.1 helix-turn-helix domain-containing protein [Chryseobacterium sp. Tr-659]
MNLQPNYKRIYIDLIEQKFPQKKNECIHILKKEQLTAIEVVMLNRILFGKENKKNHFKSYDITSIRTILKYQKENNLNNTHVAKHYGLSRNTVAKWKSKYTVQEILA